MQWHALSFILNLPNQPIGREDPTYSKLLLRIFGIAGWSGSGKTTLMTGLIPLIVRAGVTVSTVKHAHHAFDVDKPGKDSYRHREAGATEVMISSAARWALMHEHRGAPEPTLSDLIRNMTPVDLLRCKLSYFGASR